MEIARLNSELLKYINGQYDEQLKAEADQRLGEWY